MTEEMPERHTGQHVADRLIQVADQWSLSDRITACVHDNAANAVSGLGLLRLCTAHSLQLCVNSGLDVAANTQTIERLLGISNIVW